MLPKRFNIAGLIVRRESGFGFGQLAEVARADKAGEQADNDQNDQQFE